jgi:hypothetical protein
LGSAVGGQTLMSGGRLDKFDPREYKAVIVDEVNISIQVHRLNT